MNNTLTDRITAQLEREIAQSEKKVLQLKQDQSLSNIGAISLREGVVYGLQLALQTIQIESLKVQLEK